MPFNFGDLIGQAMARAKAETLQDLGGQGGRALALATTRLSTTDPGGGGSLNARYDQGGTLYGGFVVGVSLSGDTV